MAKITKEQLKKRFDIDSAYVRVYIKRGHLVQDENGLFDEEHPVNAKFISKREEGLPKVATDKVLKDKFKLEEEKLAADVDRIKSVTELNNLKLAKLHGEVVPYDLVIPIFIMFTKSIMTAFMNEDEDRLLEISHKAGLTKDEVAKLRKRSSDIVNAAVESGVKEGKKQARKIVQEFSETRGRGESK